MEPIVIARAPLSINLANHEEGPPDRLGQRQRQVIQAAINYYTYTIITNGPGHTAQIIWSGCPACTSGHCRCAPESAVELNLPHTISQKLKIRGGLTVFLAPQLPIGSGLGLSGSLCVSMIKALAFCSGVDLEPTEVAELAQEVELDLLECPVASTDSYAAALGGVNLIGLQAHRVSIEAITLSPEMRQGLEKSLMLFRVTDTDAESSLNHCTEESEAQPFGTLPKKRFVEEKAAWRRRVRMALETGDLATFGQVLKEAWTTEPQRLECGPNLLLNQCYHTAREHGALSRLGCPMPGPNFLALFCQQENQPGVTAALADLGADRWPLRLVSQGVEVLEAIPRAWARLAAAQPFPEMDTITGSGGNASQSPSW